VVDGEGPPRLLRCFCWVAQRLLVGWRVEMVRRRWRERCGVGMGESAWWKLSAVQNWAGLDGHVLSLLV